MYPNTEIIKQIAKFYQHLIDFIEIQGNPLENG